MEGHSAGRWGRVAWGVWGGQEMIFKGVDEEGVG